MGHPRQSSPSPSVVVLVAFDNRRWSSCCSARESSASGERVAMVSTSLRRTLAPSGVRTRLVLLRLAGLTLRSTRFRSCRRSARNVTVDLVNPCFVIPDGSLARFTWHLPSLSDARRAACRGRPFLLSVPGIHPAVKLVVVEADGGPRAGCPEPSCLHGAVDGGPLATAVGSCLLVSQVRSRCCRCLHPLSLLVVGLRLQLFLYHADAI